MPKEANQQYRVLIDQGEVMNTLAFDAKRFVRVVLRSIIFYSSIIVIAMTTVEISHAAGVVPTGYSASWPPGATYGIPPHSWSVGGATALYSSTSGVCTDPAIVTYLNAYWSYTPIQNIYVVGTAFPFSCHADFWDIGGHLYHATDYAGAYVTYNNFCPDNSTGTTTCICNDTYVPDATQTSCVKQQYKLSLTPETATIEPGNTYTFTATVTNQDGSPPIEDVPISVKVEVDLTSGGHVHGGSTRPKGSVSPASGNTALSINFGATKISGTHTITATCDMCSNSPLKATIDVMVDGLSMIPDSEFYALTEPDGKGGTKVIGDNGNHSGNHFLTPEAASELWRMAASYHFEDQFWQLKQARKRGQYTYIPAPLLHLNDASLIWGGKFDIQGNWAGDHQGHKKGVVIDVRANSNTGAIPLASFDNFQNMAASNGRTEAQVHCKRDGHDRQPPTCVGRDGSLDNNRHFHMLLLGVDQ